MKWRCARGIFTRARVQQDVQRIVELYRNSGRIGAVVTPRSSMLLRSASI
jgi:outer membrane protein assembly factor BamA